MIPPTIAMIHMILNWLGPDAVTGPTSRLLMELQEVPSNEYPEAHSLQLVKEEHELQFEIQGEQDTVGADDCTYALGQLICVQQKYPTSHVLHVSKDEQLAQFDIQFAQQVVGEVSRVQVELQFYWVQQNVPVVQLLHWPLANRTRDNRKSMVQMVRWQLMCVY